MSTRRRHVEGGPGVDEAVRALLLLMPRLVNRIKRLPIPEQLQQFSLTPRHLSLLSFLLFDGPLSIGELASRLEVAPTTVSLMVGDLSRQGVLDRREDDADRRRTIVTIADAHRPTIEAWLANGARAWRQAMEPLSPSQRQVVIDALSTYHHASGG